MTISSIVGLVIRLTNINQFCRLCCGRTGLLNTNLIVPQNSCAIWSDVSPSRVTKADLGPCLSAAISAVTSNRQPRLDASLERMSMKRPTAIRHSAGPLPEDISRSTLFMTLLLFVPPISHFARISRSIDGFLVSNERTHGGNAFHQPMRLQIHHDLAAVFISGGRFFNQECAVIADCPSTPAVARQLLSV